ncbi:MAG TPA: transposase, partial [Candidatus Caenarcaniphilales bacterium]
GFRWKRTRHSHRGKQDLEQKRLKQAELEMLKLAATEGYIDLKYLDESGCCLWSPMSYSYSRVGRQKRLEQTERRGRRISILGLWQPGKRFEYALACGSFKSKSYIKVMNWIAGKAWQLLSQSGRLTVIVQDQATLHTSKLTQQHWQHWQEQGLLLFFLPKYCSEMNRIEDEWHQLKAHEMAGRMFEDEYDLATAMMNGMQARSHKGGYTLERFKFNSP